MHIGEQIGDLSDRKLTWAVQLGVEHIAVNTVKDTGIQNQDGTWTGHHCITGRTFCTSAALLVLTVDRASGSLAAGLRRR